MTGSTIRGWLEQAKRILGRTVDRVEETAEGGEPAATSPPGARSGRSGDPDRETSTNAQLEGSADEPWGGNR